MTTDPPGKSGDGGAIVPSFSSFDRAVILVLAYEGGLSTDSRDSGGTTRYGISKKQYPYLDIEKLTAADAKEIYHRDYWLQFGCQDMPWPLAMVMFDSVVQFNPKGPVRWLQAALGFTGAAVDGTLGPRTLEAARTCRDPVHAALKIMQERGEYRTKVKGYDYFGKGWRRRDLNVLADAIRFYYTEVQR